MRQLVEGLDFSVPHAERGVDGVGCTNGLECPALDDGGKCAFVTGEADAEHAKTSKRGNVRRRQKGPSIVSIHQHDEHRHAFLLRSAESVCRRG